MTILIKIQEKNIIFVKLVVMKLNIYGYELLKLQLIYNVEKKNYKEQWALMVPWSHYNNTNVAAIPPVPDYLDQIAISEDDRDLLQNFHNELLSVTIDECIICCEKWFDMKVNNAGICQRCQNPQKASLFSESNHLNPGPSIQELAQTHGLKVPEPLSQVEENDFTCTSLGILNLLIARYMS